MVFFPAISTVDWQKWLASVQQEGSVNVDDDDDDVYWTVALRAIMNDYITDTVLMRKPMARLSPNLKRTEEQGTH